MLLASLVYKISIHFCYFPLSNTVIKSQIQYTFYFKKYIYFYVLLDIISNKKYIRGRIVIYLKVVFSSKFKNCFPSLYVALLPTLFFQLCIYIAENYYLDYLETIRRRSTHIQTRKKQNRKGLKLVFQRNATGNKRTRIPRETHPILFGKEKRKQKQKRKQTKQNKTRHTTKVGMYILKGN